MKESKNYRIIAIIIIACLIAGSYLDIKVNKHQVKVENQIKHEWGR